MSNPALRLRLGPPSRREKAKVEGASDSGWKPMAASEGTPPALFVVKSQSGGCMPNAENLKTEAETFNERISERDAPALFPICAER